jgi:hypothetical protein
MSFQPGQQCWVGILTPEPNLSGGRRGKTAPNPNEPESN